MSRKPRIRFLACVAQTGQIFGAVHVISVLRGSQARKVLNLRHDRLDTYGAGQEYTTKAWRRLAQAFIEQGLLEQDMQHGSLRLTAEGSRVLRGERKVLVAAARVQLAQAGAVGSEDIVLFEKLRQLRKQLADSANVPPYVVFSDRSLVEMATYYPQTSTSFLAMNGVGEYKLKRYGEAFLNAIRAYCQERNLKERPKGRASAPVSTGRRRFEEVGELFAAGESLEDLQARYNVQRGTILHHLWRYAKAGHQLDAGRVLALSTLPQEQREAVLAAFGRLGLEALRPVYDALDEAIEWEELHLMRAYMLCLRQANGN